MKAKRMFLVYTNMIGTLVCFTIRAKPLRPFQTIVLFVSLKNASNVPPGDNSNDLPFFNIITQSSELPGIIWKKCNKNEPMEQNTTEKKEDIQQVKIIINVI